MAKKRTVFTWIMMVLVSIVIIIGLFDTIARLANIGSLAQNKYSDPLTTIASLTLSLIALGLWTNFFIKLYKVSPDLVKWTHITFGYAIIHSIAGPVLAMYSELSLELISIMQSLMGAENTAMFATTIVSIIIAQLIVVITALWIGFAIHLNIAKKKKVVCQKRCYAKNKKLMDFS